MKNSYSILTTRLRNESVITRKSNSQKERKKESDPERLIENVLSV